MDISRLVNPRNEAVRVDARPSPRIREVRLFHRTETTEYTPLSDVLYTSNHKAVHYFYFVVQLEGVPVSERHGLRFSWALELSDSNGCCLQRLGKQECSPELGSTKDSSSFSIAGEVTRVVLDKDCNTHYMRKRRKADRFMLLSELVLQAPMFTLSWRLPSQKFHVFARKPAPRPSIEGSAFKKPKKATFRKAWLVPEEGESSSSEARPKLVSSFPVYFR
eukprot:TRINITY_DN609_c0_g1_i4.p1 TRINITY_DN609_c0_g1~~TRINITY_DN609_c0_g1_i4.p1  ORF type:complete len:243 (+),score=34.89 TRINITY_DN609_c0_g1_i4:72-731(+)